MTPNRIERLGVTLSDEVWKDIVGFEGVYQVSTLGRVRRLGAYDTNGRWCKPQLIQPILQHSGYCHVGLWRGQVCKQRRVHRLVAEAFIPNPEGKPTVNHLNENKQDNRVENLEWATYRENTVYGSCVERRTANRRETAPNRRMRVKSIDKHGNIEYYNSISDALRKLGKNPRDGHISQCCKGKQKTAVGKRWEYVEGGDAHV